MNSLTEFIGMDFSNITFILPCVNEPKDIYP